jgi:hypothetical protein
MESFLTVLSSPPLIAPSSLRCDSTGRGDRDRAAEGTSRATYEFATGFDAFLDRDRPTARDETEADRANKSFNAA